MLAIVGLAVATTCSLALLTACNDDDDDDDLTETVDDDDTNDDSSSDTDDSSTTPGTAIDLGLSVKWSNINIGATLPADYGNYYAWGEIVTKQSYTSDNSVTYEVSSIEDFSGDATYDAATANWGSSWRMPTYAECKELVDDCTWTKTYQENSDGSYQCGYLVEGTNGNSIFLPAAGCRNGTVRTDVGELGVYWSSSPFPNEAFSNIAYCLEIIPSYRYYVNARNRYSGYSVRPVTD